MNTIEGSRLTAAHARATLLRIGLGRWRVTSSAGRVAGLVEEKTVPGGERYLARRFHWSSRSFLPIGEFWSLDDAVESLLAA